MNNISGLQKQIMEPLDKSLDKLTKVAEEGSSLKNQIKRFVKTLFSLGPTIWESDPSFRTKKLEKHITNLKIGLNVERERLKNDFEARSTIENTVIQKLDQVLDALDKLKSKMDKKALAKIKGYEEDLTQLRGQCYREIDVIKEGKKQKEKQKPIDEPAPTLPKSPSPQKTRGLKVKSPEQKAKEVRVENLKDKINTIKNINLANISNQVKSSDKNKWNQLKAQLDSLMRPLDDQSDIPSVIKQAEGIVSNLYKLTKTEMPEGLFKDFEK